jgi:hypothetical protein
MVNHGTIFHVGVSYQVISIYKICHHIFDFEHVICL